MTYDTKPPVAYPGMEGDLKPSYKVHGINEEAAAIPFGVAVTRGSSGDKKRLPAAATDIIDGVAVNSHWADNQALPGDGAVAVGRGFNLVKEGSIWVRVEEAVNDGDDAFVRFAPNGGNIQLGAFRKSVDEGTARRLKGGKYAIGAPTGGFALLVLDEKLDDFEEQVALLHAHADVEADITDKLFRTPPDRFFLVTGVDYVNPAGLVEDPATYADVKLQHGAVPTVAARWSTQTGQDGTLEPDAMVALTLGALADRLVPPGTEVALMLDVTGAPALSAGRAAIKGYYI
jgi:hypothetical protein